ncbi:MAG: hypothetical protein OXC62_04895, partial [Aestuariivita sp.]|nr:hypothetical protein [Aestuariivita sp.]
IRALCKSNRFDRVWKDLAYDQFSAFVRKSVVQKSFLAGIWPSLLLEMVKEFIQTSIVSGRSVL